MTERRENLRRRTYLGGLITFDGVAASHDCVVRNLSQNGAKLSFAHPPDISGPFEIAIHKRGRHHAQMVWLDYNMAGVRFTPGPAAIAPAPQQPASAELPPRSAPMTPPEGAAAVICFAEARLRLRPAEDEPPA